MSSRSLLRPLAGSGSADPLRRVCPTAVIPPRRRLLSTTQQRPQNQVQTLLQDKENGFGFIRSNLCPEKPRKVGVTEIRGPYYSSYRRRHLQGVLETMGHHVDGLKFAGGSFSLMPEKAVREMIESGMKVKPELGIQFVAVGHAAVKDLEAAGTSDPAKVVNLAKRFFNEAGVERIMVESERITGNVKSWRTDVILTILQELPSEMVMFEAADPPVFNWYIREFEVDVNLFVDHSQIVQLSYLRTGIWGMADTFGKVMSYRD